jgi:hypothetical protein
LETNYNHGLTAILLVTFILISVLCSNLFESTSAQRFANNVAISNSQKSSEQAISAYANNVYVVWRDESTGNGDIYFRKSTNYGNNFAPTELLSNNTGSSSQVKIASDGNNVYVVWRDETTGNGDIYFKKSNDSGSSFEKRVFLYKSIGSSSEPQISSNGNNVYVVWRDETTGNGDIYFKKSNDSGSSFEKRKYLFQSNGSSSEPQISSNGNNVYVVWRDETTGNGDIYFRKSSDYGKNFERTFQLSNSAGSSSEPQISSNGNNVYVVWRDETTGNGDIYFRASDDSGEHFRGVKNLAINSGSSSEPQISSNGNNVYVVWRDETTGNGDIYFRKGSDYGKNFEDREKLSDDDASSAEVQMSTYQNNLYFIWTQSTFNNTKIFFDSSRNFGSDFYNEVDLSRNVTLSYDPRMYISNDIVYVVWRDGNKIGYTDIYFKRINEEFR